MNKILARFAASLLTLQLLSACDSPSALQAGRTESALVSVRVNIVPGASAQSASTVQIADPSQLPESLRNASQLRVIFDSSRTTTTVTRNADGSLSFPLLTARSFGSGSSLTVLMSGDGGVSIPVQLLTGNPVQLQSQAITVEPASTVSLGTRVKLMANVAGGASADKYTYTWEVAPSAAGPWQTVSGSGVSVEWEPRAAGSYYVRLGFIDNATRSSSSYLSPTPLIYVQSAERLATTNPASGGIVAGDEIGLSVALEELKADSNLQWSYAATAQGPFQPIADRGPSIRWEPPAAGSYYLRLQSEQGGRISTYTSGEAEVLVAAPDEVIVTDPPGGSIVRGQSLTLATTLSGLSNQASYSWFYAFSPVGPFTPLAESGASVKWTPPLTGEFYIRLRTYDPSTDQSRTYTSSKTEVSVRDSNNVFSTSPDPASVRRGERVSLTLNQAPSEQVIWSYASSLQGTFAPINDTGSTVDWTPTEAGSFYLRAIATRADGSTTTFTSADPLVFVAERSGVIQTMPSSGELNLGQPVTLRADVSDPSSQLRYVWSFGTSATGTFSPIPTLETSPLQSVTWYPPIAGSYFVRVEVTNPASQSSVSFTSSEPVVRVTETTPFFTTDPVNGLIEPDDNIRLRAAFETNNRSFNFGWAYSTSTAGPFTPIGGSSGPEVQWDDDGKPLGSYYIRLQATAPGSDRSLSFVSRYPIVFVDRNVERPGNEFGTPDPNASTGTGFPF